MLSLQFIRENPDIVRAAIKNKSVKVDLDSFLACLQTKTVQQQLVENLRARKNDLSSMMSK